MNFTQFRHGFTQFIAEITWKTIFSVEIEQLSNAADASSRQFMDCK